MNTDEERHYMAYTSYNEIESCLKSECVPYKDVIVHKDFIKEYKEISDTYYHSTHTIK